MLQTQMAQRLLRRGSFLVCLGFVLTLLSLPQSIRAGPADGGESPRETAYLLTTNLQAFYVDSLGVALCEIPLGDLVGFVSGVAIADTLASDFWLVTETGLAVHLSAGGEWIESFPLVPEFGTASDVAVTDTSVWVCTEASTVAEYTHDGDPIGDFSVAGYGTPAGIAVDCQSSTIWIVDEGGGLKEFTTNGEFLQSLTPTCYAPSPSSLDIDPNTCEFYITDRVQNALYKVSASGGWCEWINIDGMLGLSGGAIKASAVCDSQGELCHDGFWGAREKCGYDARRVTGIAEMNKTCIVDYLDFHLFAEQYLQTGPNLSADLDGDGYVGLSDFSIFGFTYGDTVPMCTPSPLPDDCSGTLALSFSSDPNTIVSTQSQMPGPHTVYVVASGWTDPELVEYGIDASSNITVFSHTVLQPHLLATMSCNSAGERSYHAYSATAAGWPAGPITLAQIDYFLFDTNPASFKLTPIPECGSSHVRWMSSALDINYDFETLSSAGINGPAPPDTSTCVATGVADGVPDIGYELGQNYPNPFNPSTMIPFHLPATSIVNLAVYNVSGERVCVLVEGPVPAGWHEAVWDGKDASGAAVASGVYFYRMHSKAFSQTKKLVLLK